MRSELTAILLLMGLLLGTNSCKKKDEATPAVRFKVYKNQTGDINADALQAQLVNSSNNATLNYYGTFDGNGDALAINSMSFIRQGNDTTLYYIINRQTNRLGTIYYEISGLKQPEVLKFDYNGIDSTFLLSIYDYDWGTEQAVLKFETEIVSSGGKVDYLPEYINLKTTGLDDYTNMAFEAARSISWQTIAIGGEAMISIYSGAKMHPAAGAALTLAILTKPAFFTDPIDILPADTPHRNPSTGKNNPTSKLPPSPCKNTHINFSVIMARNTDIIFSGVSGGQPPYTYSIGNLAHFQTGEVFLGPNQENKSYLLIVKDANGCAGAKVKTLTKDLTPLELSGIWTLEMAVGFGRCAETLLEDTTHIPPTFHFNGDGTITFDTDPAGNDLNAPKFTNTYTYSNDTLTIKSHLVNLPVENIRFDATLVYDHVLGLFLGTYWNIWTDNYVCIGQTKVYK
jgi:hypothetical protein